MKYDVPEAVLVIYQILPCNPDEASGDLDHFLCRAARAARARIMSNLSYMLTEVPAYKQELEEAYRERLKAETSKLWNAALVIEEWQNSRLKAIFLTERQGEP